VGPLVEEGLYSKGAMSTVYVAVSVCVPFVTVTRTPAGRVTSQLLVKLSEQDEPPL